MKENSKIQLKKLIKEWDRKLKDSGFVDIENRKTGMLITWAGSISCDDKHAMQKANYGYTSLVWKESQAEYYRIASQCLHDRDFRNELEREIWELHVDGHSYKEISKKINVTLDKARRTIERLAKEFGLKK